MYFSLKKIVAEGKKKRVEEIKKWKSSTKYQTQIRQAKAFVINVMGEFAKTCQSKQVLKLYRLIFQSSGKEECFQQNLVLYF